MKNIEDMTLDELSQVLMECQKALAELKESKKEGKWKPKDGEEYWFMGDDGDLMYSNFDSQDSCDKWRVQNLPIFKTHGKAHRYWVFMEHVKEKSYEFSKEEWEDSDIGKWRIIYDGEVKGFCVHENYLICVFNATYFKNREDAQYIIDNFKDELMEYWL